MESSFCRKDRLQRKKKRRWKVILLPTLNQPNLRPKQFFEYCSGLIYLDISYGILAWRGVYKTHIRKIQVKQNHIVRLLFLAKSSGSETEKIKPLLNLLGLLTVNYIYRVQALKFLHSWPPAWSVRQLTCFNVLVTYMATTKDMQPSIIFISWTYELI